MKLFTAWWASGIPRCLLLLLDSSASTSIAVSRLRLTGTDGFVGWRKSIEFKANDSLVVDTDNSPASVCVSTHLKSFDSVFKKWIIIHWIQFSYLWDFVSVWVEEEREAVGSVCAEECFFTEELEMSTRGTQPGELTASSFPSCLKTIGLRCRAALLSERRPIRRKLTFLFTADISNWFWV